MGREALRAKCPRRNIAVVGDGSSIHPVPTYWPAHTDEEFPAGVAAFARPVGWVHGESSSVPSAVTAPPKFITGPSDGQTYCIIITAIPRVSFHLNFFLRMAGAPSSIPTRHLPYLIRTVSNKE